LHYLLVRDDDTTQCCNANLKEIILVQEELSLEGAHAELSASSAHRWIQCPASVKASRGVPDSTSEAAEEGTAAHFLAEQCLVSKSPAKSFLGKTFNGYVVTAEMADFVQVYVDYCNSIAGDRTFIEAKLDYSLWAKGGFGTADFLRFGAGEAWVVDLKYGRMPVAADCPQLKCYALGVINQFGFRAQLDTIHMVIVQPRLGTVDVHTMRHTELLKWGKQILQPAATAALSDTAEFNPGESQCRFCRAAADCKPLAAHALEKATMGLHDLTQAPVEANKLTASELAALLPHLALIKSWCEKVASKAQLLANEGFPIEGYKLVRAKTNRRWSNEQEALQLLQKLTNEPVSTTKAISPTQAIKILGVESEELKSLIIKPEGKPSLVPVSDRRAEINALEGFQVIET